MGRRMAGMSPELLKMAQEQMAKMSPAEMEELRRMQSQMDPGTMRMMQEQLSSMSPEQIAAQRAMMDAMSPEERARAQEELRRLTPEEVARRSAGMRGAGGGGPAPVGASSQEAYFVGGATQLKNEGNRLFQAGDYAGAEAKYARARDNLRGRGSEEARKLLTLCRLNLANVYLKVDGAESLSKCVEETSAVLSDLDPRSLKGLYRRALAFERQGEWARALADARRAARGHPGEDSVQELVARLEAACEGRDDGGDTARWEAEGKAEEERARPAEAAGAGAGGGLPDNYMDDPRVQAQMERMREDPEAAKKVAESLESMTPEQAEAIRQQTGQSITPEQAKAAASMFKNMSSEEMEKMMKLSAEMKRSGFGAAPPSASGSGSSAAAAVTPGAPPSDMKISAEQAKMAASMMKNMDADSLASLAAASGMHIGEKEAKHVADLMGKMSDEQIATMMSLSQKLQAPIRIVRKTKEVLWSQTARAIYIVVFAILVAMYMTGRL